MAKLIIGNGFNEAMVGDITKSSLTFRYAVASEAKRLGWFVEKNDVIVLPSSISEVMQNYIGRTLEKDISNVTFIPASEDILNPSILTSDVLLNDEFIERLSNIINSSHSWKVFPYFFTSSIIHLCQRLNISITNNDNKLSFVSQCGADILNSKAVFRSIAAGYNVPIPPGYVCRTPLEMYWAMQELFGQNKTVIIKQNLNASGDGNIAVTIENLSSYPGVCEIFKLETYKNITLELANLLWHKLSDAFGNNQLIIEAYFSSKYTIYSEYEIFPNKLGYKRNSHGIVRMDSSGDKRGNGMTNWIGFQIPFALPKSVSDAFLSQSNLLAQVVSSLGYNGHINFDAIVTNDDDVLFTEINGRLGGCTHLHFIAEKLISSNYLATHCILTRNRVVITDLAHAFKAASSLCTASQSSGIIILNEDMTTMGTIEYMVYAPSVAEASFMEKKFAQLLLNKQS